MEGGPERYPCRFEAAISSFLCGKGPRGGLYIEFVLKVMLPLDGSQSCGAVRTLAECLIPLNSRCECDGTLHHTKGFGHQIK